MHFILSCPWWFILFCIAIAGIYTALLYYKEDKFNLQNGGKKLYYGLIALRFSSTFLIAFLLLSPFVKIIQNIVEEPVVGIIIDNSESILQDQNFNSKAFFQQIEQLENKLGARCKVLKYSMGSVLQRDSIQHFSDKETDISGAIEEIDNVYYNQNLAAVVIASDGLYNKGINPLYTKTNASFPIYTIALGDSTLKKDIAIADVHHNKFAYLGDKTSIEIDVEANNCKGENSTISIYQIGKGTQNKLSSEPIQIKQTQQNSTVKAMLDCNNTGISHYRVVASTISGEVSTQNNIKDFFIEVLDGRKKILIVGNAPHPDMTALKQTLENSKNYEVKIDVKNSTIKTIKDYHLIVMHQLPSNTNQALEWNKAIIEYKIPCLYILGTASNLNQFNSFQPNIEVQKQTDIDQDIIPTFNANFELFTLSEELKSFTKRYPPLVFPYSVIKQKSPGNVLMKQRIGQVETEYPMMCFGDQAGVKNGYILGDGIWRWRLYEFQQSQSHQYFDELFLKIFNYLAVKKDNRPFRVNLAKQIFHENEAVKIEAQLYNQSFELVNDPDASIQIKNGEGKVFQYQFAKTEKFYTLDIGFLPAGDYTYTANCNFNGVKHSTNGSFIISPLQIELMKTTANHQLMNTLAAKRNGAMFYPNQMEELAKMMMEKIEFKNILYESSQTNPINNLWWVMGIIILLLGIEWLLRKYFGGY